MTEEVKVKDKQIEEQNSPLQVIDNLKLQLAERDKQIEELLKNNTSVINALIMKNLSDQIDQKDKQIEELQRKIGEI